VLSGTSIDAVDAALLRIETASMETVCALNHEIEHSLRGRLSRLAEASSVSPDEVGTLDRQFAIVCAEAVRELLRKAHVDPEEISAIGSHGQTIRHRPDPAGQMPGFTWQIGDPNTIAEMTGILTVADFRRRDVAAGGQGAPLVPAFHDAVFRKMGVDRVIANVGGISNVTLLPGDPEKVIGGFDTGPGNVLLDGWIRRHHQRDFDDDGSWAASGSISRRLLAGMLRHPYLPKPAPKSTGREEFNLEWLDELLGTFGILDPADVQATLLEFTAVTLCESIQTVMPNCTEVYLCGGGSRNSALRTRVKSLLGTRVTVADTASLGVHPDWVEACAFAWMAWRTLRGEPSNLPGVTGASRAACLGGIYPGRLRPLRLEGE
jgi:anhydro-N-acetylmuramic acid kinase